MGIQNNPGYMEANAFSGWGFISHTEALGLCLFKYWEREGAEGRWGSS